MGEASRLSSELCKACKTFPICHESQKTIARSCQHFEGVLPEGYLMYRSAAVLFIRKKGFASKIGYLDLPKRVWLSEWQVRDLVASAVQVK